MIPFEAALLAWIPISFACMIDRDNARGFTLAFVLSMLILPAGQKLEIGGIPNIDKNNVAGIGVLLGTLAFHPGVINRFRLSIVDFLLAGCLAGYFFSSYTNGFGVRDGLSQALEFGVFVVIPVVLARLHLGTPHGLKTFLMGLVLASIVYTPFALWEFRFSPQIHTTVYGFFQHQFAQHMRGGFYRPVVCFSHALALGRFFAFAAFLALFPLRGDLEARFGRLGKHAYLVPLFGLLLSMSYSPYLLFALLCGGYYLIQHHPRWLLGVPVAAFVWFGLSIGGMSPGLGVVEQISSVNEERAASLQYRLDAIVEYRDIFWVRPLFGQSGWGLYRSGRATDSQALISLLSRGAFGFTCYYGLWFACMYFAYRVYRITAASPFGPKAAASALFLSMAITITAVDAAFDLHVLLLAAAVVPLYQRLRRMPNSSPLPRMQPAARLA